MGMDMFGDNFAAIYSSYWEFYCFSSEVIILIVLSFISSLMQVQLKD
jgi:hypothetical protein